MQRRLVTRIELVRPQLEFVRRSSPEKSQTSINGSWQEKVEKLYPFTINRFLILHGQLGYRDETAKPKINLSFREIESDVENITNANHSNGDLPSSVVIKAQALNTGDFEARADVNFLADPITANVKGYLHHLALVDINEFSRAYGNFAFKGGDLQVTFEAAATPTRYHGYAKTLLHQVKIFDWSKDATNVGHLIWQGVAALVVNIFTNGKRDQFAAKIPFDGSRKDLKVEKWETVVSIFRNAFVAALSPKFEDVVEVKTNSIR